MKFEIKVFSFNSAEYRQSLELRYRILRKPLNLQFTEAELKKDETDTHIGLFSGDTIIACLILSKHKDEKMKMRQVAVDKIHQGKGLGKKLSLAAEEYAKEIGFKIMFCHAREVAVPFYQKLGYRVVGERFTEVNIPHFAMEKQLRQTANRIYLPIMKFQFVFIFAIVFGGAVLSVSLLSCKSCKKEKPVEAVTADSGTTSVIIPPNMLNISHADTSIVPLLTKVLEDAFDASNKKDYTRLGSAIVYRGPDSTKQGYGVFNAKNKFDKTVVKITADVFNKWNKGVESKEYPRAFELPQPDGRTMPVLEVIFISPKNINRKFFGFLLIGEEWKIADVTSNL